MKVDIKDYIEKCNEIDRLELLSLVSNLDKPDITERERQAVLLTLIVSKQKDVDELLKGSGLTCEKQDFFVKFLVDDNFYAKLSVLDSFKNVIVDCEGYAQFIAHNINPKTDLSCSPDMINDKCSIINPFVDLNSEGIPKFTFSDEAKVKEFEEEFLPQLARAFGYRKMTMGSNEKGIILRRTEKSRSRDFNSSILGSLRLNNERRMKAQYNRLCRIAGEEAVNYVMPLTKEELKGVYSFKSSLEFVANTIYDLVADSFDSGIILNREAKDNKKYSVAALQYFATNAGETFDIKDVGLTRLLAILYATKYIIAYSNLDKYTQEGATQELISKLKNDIALVASKCDYRPFVMVSAHEVAKKIAKQFFTVKGVDFDAISNMFTTEGATDNIHSFDEAMFRTLYNPAEVEINNIMQRRIAQTNNVAVVPTAEDEKDISEVDDSTEVEDDEPELIDEDAKVEDDEPAKVKTEISVMPDGYQVYAEEILARKAKRKSIKEVEISDFSDSNVIIPEEVSRIRTEDVQPEEKASETVKKFEEESATKPIDSSAINPEDEKPKEKTFKEVNEFEKESTDEEKESSKKLEDDMSYMKDKIDFNTFHDNVMTSLGEIIYEKFNLEQDNAPKQAMQAYFYILSKVISKSFLDKEDLEYIKDYMKDFYADRTKLVEIIDRYEASIYEFSKYFDDKGYALVKTMEECSNDIVKRFSLEISSTKELFDKHVADDSFVYKQEFYTYSEMKNLLHEQTLEIFGKFRDVLGAICKKFDDEFVETHERTDEAKILNKVNSNILDACQYVLKSEDDRKKYKESVGDKIKNPYIKIADFEQDTISSFTKKYFADSDALISEDNKKNILNNYTEKMRAMIQLGIKEQKALLYRNLQKKKRRFLANSIFERLKDGFRDLDFIFGALGANEEVSEALKQLNQKKIDLAYVLKSADKLAESNTLVNDICNKCRVHIKRIVEEKHNNPDYFGSDEYKDDINAIILEVENYLKEKNTPTSGLKEKIYN